MGFKDVQFLGGGPDVVEDCGLREGVNGIQAQVGERC